MKKFLKTCYKCATEVREARVIKEGVTLSCLRCPQCGEEYFTSRELIKFDILTGKRKLVRKFGTLGDSIVMRLPPKILEDYKIQSGDYALFEEKPDGILIKPISAKELKIEE